MQICSRVQMIDLKEDDGEAKMLKTKSRIELLVYKLKILANHYLPNKKMRI